MYYYVKVLKTGNCLIVSDEDFKSKINVKKIKLNKSYVVNVSENGPADFRKVQISIFDESRESIKRRIEAKRPLFTPISRVESNSSEHEVAEPQQADEDGDDEDQCESPAEGRDDDVRSKDTSKSIRAQNKNKRKTSPETHKSKKRMCPESSVTSMSAVLNVDELPSSEEEEESGAGEQDDAMQSALHQQLQQTSAGLKTLLGLGGGKASTSTAISNDTNRESSSLQDSIEGLREDVQTLNASFVCFGGALQELRNVLVPFIKKIEDGSFPLLISKDQVVPPTGLYQNENHSVPSLTVVNEKILLGRSIWLRMKTYKHIEIQIGTGNLGSYCKILSVYVYGTDIMANSSCKGRPCTKGATTRESEAVAKPKLNSKLFMAVYDAWRAWMKSEREMTIEEVNRESKKYRSLIASKIMYINSPKGKKNQKPIQGVDLFLTPYDDVPLTAADFTTGDDEDDEDANNMNEN